MSVTVEAGFLLDFAAERGFGRFAPFDFAAGNAPEIRPFVGADHQHFARAVENQRADGGERRMGFLKIFRRRFEAEIVLLQNAAQFAEMLDNQIRLRRAQLLQRVVAGEHGAGMDAAVMRGFDVVLHVADEQRFVRRANDFRRGFRGFFPACPKRPCRACRERRRSR